MLRNLDDAISPAGRKCIGNWLAAIPPYRMPREKTYRQPHRCTVCHCSALSDRKFLSPPECQAPFPVKNFATIMRCSKTIAVKKVQVDIFIRFDTILACDRRTRCHSKDALCIYASCSKNQEQEGDGHICH